LRQIDLPTTEISAQNQARRAVSLDYSAIAAEAHKIREKAIDLLFDTQFPLADMEEPELRAMRRAGWVDTNF
jgi:hypothetical protein